MTPSQKKGTPKSRKERRQAQAREDILDAATAVLLRDGTAKFRLLDVARELGLTKAALYYYYPGRDALLMAVMARYSLSEAQAIHAAVSETSRGTDAIEALIRTTLAFHTRQPELFSLFYRGVFAAGPNPPKPDEASLAAIRPTNALIYGSVSERIAADQREGRIPAEIHPRRHAFLAHMAVMGVIAMKLLVESFGDPLIHRDEDLVVDLIRTFTAELRGDG